MNKTDLNPGPILDALVLSFLNELALKADLVKIGALIANNDPESTAFSTNIEAANRVKLALENRGYTLLVDPRDGVFCAYLATAFSPDWTVRGESEAHAICLAALKIQDLMANHPIHPNPPPEE